LKTALVRKLMKHRPYAKGSALIRVCSICGLIRDESGVAVEEERWVTKRTYEKTSGMSLAECHLTHTHCPGCFMDFMERVLPPQSSLGMDR